jgi:hypothetical protein
MMETWNARTNEGRVMAKKENRNVITPILSLSLNRYGIHTDVD